MSDEITIDVGLVTFNPADEKPRTKVVFSVTDGPERARQRVDAFLAMFPVGLYLGRDRMVYPRAVVIQRPADLDPGVDIPAYILSPEGIAAIRQNIAYRSDADGHTMGILAYALARIREALDSDCGPEERSERIQKALDGEDSEP